MASFRRGPDRAAPRRPAFHPPRRRSCRRGRSIPASRRPRPLKQVSEEQMIDASGHLRVLRDGADPLHSGEVGPAGPLVGLDRHHRAAPLGGRRPAPLVAGTAGTTRRSFPFAGAPSGGGARQGQRGGGGGARRAKCALWRCGRTAARSTISNRARRNALRRRDPGARGLRASPAGSPPSSRTTTCWSRWASRATSARLSSARPARCSGWWRFFDREPVHDPSKFRDLFTLFASRAAAELERQHIEEQRRRPAGPDAARAEAREPGRVGRRHRHDFNNLLTGILGNTSLAQCGCRAPRRPPPTSPRSNRRRSGRPSWCSRCWPTPAGAGVPGRGARLQRAGARDGRSAAYLDLAKGRSSSSSSSRGPLRVKIDATQIRQVVMNLITNASDALGENASGVRLSHPAGLRAAAASDRGHGLPRRAPRSCSRSRTAASAWTRRPESGFSTRSSPPSPRAAASGSSALLGIVRGRKGAVLVESAVGSGRPLQGLPAGALGGRGSRRPGS